MLNLPKRFQILKTTYQQPAYATVEDTDDELLQAIAEDVSDHDNDWELEEHPDADALERFWKDVEQDIASDPLWINISQDED